MVKPNKLSAPPQTLRLNRSRWCWIGNERSAYLDALVAWLEATRAESEDDDEIQVQLVSVASIRKVRKVLSKTNADVFVWEIDTDGIAGVLDELAWAKRQHASNRHRFLTAGLVSPAERVCLLEAGAELCIETPNDWRSLAKHRLRF